MTENDAAETARENLRQEHVAETRRNAAEESDVEQDAGVGPIDGDEAMDDDTEFTHTPISPAR